MSFPGEPCGCCGVPVLKITGPYTLVCIDEYTSFEKEAWLCDICHNDRNAYKNRELNRVANLVINRVQKLEKLVDALTGLLVHKKEN